MNPLTEIREEYASKNPYDSKQMLYAALGVGAVAAVGYLIFKSVPSPAAPAMSISFPPNVANAPAPANTFTGGTAQLGTPAAGSPAVGPGTYVVLQDTLHGGVTGGALLLVAVQTVVGTSGQGVIQGILPVPNGTVTPLSNGQQANFSTADVIAVTSTLPTPSAMVSALEGGANSSTGA